LLDSGLVTTYSNPSYAYEILMPSKWLAISLNTGLDQIRFLTDGDTGEFIFVEVFENELDWDILDYSKGLNIQGLLNYNLAGRPALISKDSLSVYTITEDYLYQIIYDKANNETVNFETVYSMMLNSFVILDEEVPTENPEPPGEGIPGDNDDE